MRFVDPSTDLPEPHEGVMGEDRSDDPLLSLDDAQIAVRKLLLGVHQNLVRLLWGPLPVQEEIRAFVNGRPDDGFWSVWTPGDFLVEVSACLDGEERMVKGSGRVLLVREEWAWTREEEEAAKAADPGEDYTLRATDEATYIQYGQRPGDVCRWTNCRFTRVPFT
jgi:hypothetical protein